LKFIAQIQTAQKSDKRLSEGKIGALLAAIDHEIRKNPTIQNALEKESKEITLKGKKHSR